MYYSSIKKLWGSLSITKKNQRNDFSFQEKVNFNEKIGTNDFT